MCHRSTDGYYLILYCLSRQGSPRAIIKAHKCRTKRLCEHWAKYFTYVIFHTLSKVLLLEPLTDKDTQIKILR